MARTVIEARALYEVNKCIPAMSAETVPMLIDSTDGGEFTWSERDGKHLLFVLNRGSTAGTLTIKAGNGIQGVNDFTTEMLNEQECTYLTIESGRFKNVCGIDKGKIILQSSAGAQICVAIFKLP